MAFTNASDVVLIINADTDIAHEAAGEILDSGARVVVTARIPAALTRMLLQRSAEQVVAIAADLGDARQRRKICERVLTTFGAPTWVVDGHTGEAVAIGSGAALTPAA
ncbi:hypothetical protein BVC93_26665 [Mycobacterium sp. MS1601]|uniref:SDR family NAD(P)-dependent oxidoreductase n=1 Tax=Mycobacterium sp. MS1601 TaxID=1936029 RepID=UPI00097934D4|nr:SDR family NAD(P)-dependent oxidoreductase [Mycobacterium sp. MS1601]AQA05375.1 hypothetical protein BVC93_26665 [Mycobacterium sp. MS1601]